MAYIPATIDGAPVETDEQLSLPPFAEDPYFPVLDAVTSLLADGFDHPEVWSALSQAAEHDDVVGLRVLIDQLMPMQSGATRKSMGMVGAVLEALSIDHDRGLHRLDRMAIDHAHCPQIAGAQFFLQRHHDPERSSDLSQRFCEQPFTKFETLMDGTVSPCCSIWTQTRFGNLDGQTASEIWNSHAAQSMRASILNGDFGQCNKQRCTLIMEDKLPLRKDISDPVLREIIDEQLTTIASAPRYLMLAHDVTCNLACPSCRDGVQIASESAMARFDVIEQDVFRPMLDKGDAVIALSGLGDPWSSPHYRSILRYMADNTLNVGLNIHTNALLMGPRRWAEYSGLDQYRALINISIDSCTPWAYAVIRRPGKWTSLLPNLQFIAAKRSRGEFRELHLNATIQLDNFHEMPAMVDFAEQLGADSMRMYMIQQTGGHIEHSYSRLNVGNIDHPLHQAFLETLRDPRLGSPTAHLYDVATWRARAFDATLPSDRLGAGYLLDDMLAAIAETDDPATKVALCAAGRTRFRTDLILPLLEAEALNALGFQQQATYRLNERMALGGELIKLF